MPDVTTRPGLAVIGWQIAKDANRTLGGGFASIELIRRSFASRGWLDDRTHAMLVAVSRFTPGTNVLAYCAALGWRVHRVSGMAAALAAASVPGSLAVTALSAVIAQLAAVPLVRAGLAVATLVAAGWILAAAWALVRPYVAGPRRAWTVLVAVAAAVLFAVGIPPVRVLLIAAVFGALSPGRGDAE